MSEVRVSVHSRYLREDANMRPPGQSDSSFAEIIESIRLNRENLIRAIRQASPEALDASAERIKDVLRKPEGVGQRRKRIAPPAFYKPAK